MREDKGLSASISARELAERLEQYPALKLRFEQLLAVVENTQGDAVKADEAEERITQELRHIGQTALQSWAERKNRRVVADADRRTDMRHKEKKGSTGRPDMGESR